MVDRTKRPIVPTSHPDEIEHRRQLADRANAGLPKDGTEGMTSPLLLMSYAVADVPDATLWESALIYVSDETGGAIPAFSDGTSWRRVSDRAIVS